MLILALTGLVFCVFALIVMWRTHRAPIMRDCVIGNSAGAAARAELNERLVLSLNGGPDFDWSRVEELQRDIREKIDETISAADSAKL